MKITLPCAKNCGGTLTVGDDEINEAKELGVALVAQHEVCPRDQLDGSIYRVVIQVWRKRPRSIYGNMSAAQPRDELLTTVGGKAESADFKTAIPVLGKQLSEQWDRVIGMADIIDSDPEVIEQMQEAAEEEAADYEAKWQAEHKGEYAAPCGQLFDSFQLAKDHEAHCDQCAGAQEKFYNN